MRSKKKLLESAKLYVVLDTSVADFEKLFSVLKKTVCAGTTIVQLRSKQEPATEILAFCQKAVRYLDGKALVIVNDRLDLALASQVDGVHLGQEDMPLKAARKLLGPQKLIGISAQTIAQARRAQRDGADYIGFGSVFKTQTKPQRDPMDVRLISLAAQSLRIPVFFIGGITPENVQTVIDHGGRRVAVTRAICQAKDVNSTTKMFLKTLGSSALSI